MKNEWLDHVYENGFHRVTIFGDEKILKGLTQMIRSLGNKVFIPEDHPRELFKYDPDNDHTFRYMDAGCDLCMIEGEKLIQNKTKGNTIYDLELSGCEEEWAMKIEARLRALEEPDRSENRCFEPFLNDNVITPCGNTLGWHNRSNVYHPFNESLDDAIDAIKEN